MCEKIVSQALGHSPSRTFSRGFNAFQAFTSLCLLPQASKVDTIESGRF